MKKFIISTLALITITAVIDPTISEASSRHHKVAGHHKHKHHRFVGIDCCSSDTRCNIAH